MYKLTKVTSIIRVSDGAIIPNDPANTDYTAYLEWLSKGNDPLPIDPPTAEELAQIARQQADQDAIATTKADNAIQYLVNHTPAEIETFIRNQVGAGAVTNQAGAIAAIKVLETLLVKLAQAASTVMKDRLR